MSKLRIEKLKQGNASNNDVLVFRNDLGTFQGQSNLSVNTITLGTSTVNSSVYTGTANNTTYLNGQLASYYTNLSAADATTKAATAYANAVTYTNNLAATAYSNAVTQAASLADAAYANAATIAATAYSNAIAYAASNTYVNTQLGLKASLDGAAFTGAVSIANSANVTGSLQVGGVLTVAGNLVINGTTTTVNTSSINVTDSLLYLASNNEVSDSLDIGFAAHYNAGSGANGHTGLIRSAVTKKYYLFQNYQPEFFANNTVDVSNTATGIQMADLVVGNLVANSTLSAGNTTITGTLNTSGLLTANVIAVSNVSATQQNLQVDAAGTATAMAIVFGG